MSVEFAVFLGLVQAFTEFLPVSSSGHLVVLQLLLGPRFGAENIPLSFDVLVHAGTLGAILIYLRQDIRTIVSLIFEKSEEGAHARRFAILLVISSIPAALVGLLLKSQVERLFETLSAATLGFFITALLLAIAHHTQKQNSITESTSEALVLSWRLPSITQGILIGIAQAIAIIPGVSRSGSTIAVALLLGLPVTTALRFSFFLAIPAISGATMLEASALVNLSAELVLPYSLGFLVALAGGWIAIGLLVALTKGLRLLYFSAYTFLLGTSLYVLS